MHPHEHTNSRERAHPPTHTGDHCGGGCAPRRASLLRDSHARLPGGQERHQRRHPPDRPIGAPGTHPLVTRPESGTRTRRCTCPLCRVCVGLGCAGTWVWNYGAATTTTLAVSFTVGPEPAIRVIGLRRAGQASIRIFAFTRTLEHFFRVGTLDLSAECAIAERCKPHRLQVDLKW
jgi:hypothetical protein